MKVTISSPFFSHFSTVNLDVEIILQLRSPYFLTFRQPAGYATHMLGKWHLGHYSPRALPTARGFDDFVGYLTGEHYYWSKKVPEKVHFTDFLAANASCYWPYQDDDKHDYSTFLYTTKAVEIIEHADVDTPFFMYLAFQAVHDPFTDVNEFPNGIPKGYVGDDVYEQVREFMYSICLVRYLCS
jgi:arylsulfatase A-like enzyme